METASDVVLPIASATTSPLAVSATPEMPADTLSCVAARDSRPPMATSPTVTPLSTLASASVVDLARIPACTALTAPVPERVALFFVRLVAVDVFASTPTSDTDAPPVAPFSATAPPSRSDSTVSAPMTFIVPSASMKARCSAASAASTTLTATRTPPTLTWRERPSANALTEPSARTVSAPLITALPVVLKYASAVVAALALATLASVLARFTPTPPAEPVAACA